jgi:sugar phosphate isomerase/epimerase
VTWDEKFLPRLGATSYIVEAGLVENLLRLPERIGEMQLVLFEADGFSNIPDESEAHELASVGRERGIAFTVHLPGIIDLASDEAPARARSLELFRRTVERTKCLEPICWVFHAVNPDSPPPHANKAKEKYVERLAGCLSELMPLLDTPRELAIENVRPDFHVESEIIKKFDTSICIDIGHLILFGQEVPAFLDEWLPRCRNVHLHGIDETGRDHASLALIPADNLAFSLRRLSGEASLATVTMEVFGERDFASSLAAVERCLAANGLLG